MRLLDLPHGYQTCIDEADVELVKGLTLYRGPNGYVYFSVWHHGRSHPQTLHSLLMNGPKGTHTDHVNGDKLDNRRSNLRVTTPSLNQVNRKRLNRNNHSGIRGVAFTVLSLSKPWRAQIMAHGKNHHIGLFETQEQAIQARRAAELELWGESSPS